MAKTSEESALALARELRMALRALYRRVREQAHPGDLTSAQKSVILLLERDGPATVATLAKAEGVRHQSMRITVASLEQLGALRGEPDPADGRQTLLQLTPAFLKTLLSGRAAREDYLFRALQAQLTPREREQLSAAIKLLDRLATF
jgi:DNA-binding MarR family transcriptional regulator